MKNTNNKSLNDLFRAARDEANPELISNREAEQLLVNSAMRSLPAKQTIGQQLYELLFSTPLKIGITTMTTATCIALGIFAFWPQTATNNSLASTSQGTKMTQGTYGTNKPHETVASLQNSLPLTTISQTPDKQIFYKTEPLSIALPQPIATADSLHPIELSPEQLAQLGIVLEDNGDIDFYTKSKTTGEINKFGLPPTWGVKLYMGKNISEAEIAGLQIPNSDPRLVTEPDGAKRLFSFENDTTIELKNGQRTMLMHMQNQTSIAPGQSSKQLDQHHPVMIKMSAGSGTERNVEVSEASDSLPGNIHGSIRTIVNATVDDSSIIRNTTINKNVREQLTNVNMDSIMAAINVDSILATLNVDSIARSAHPELHGQSMDSVLNEVRMASKNIKQMISSMQIHIDSSSKSSLPSLSVEINTNDDDQAGVPPLKEIEQAANALSLDHLIPIRIRNTKNAAHPNELIFWYEPTPEVTAAIPDASVSEPAPQSKQLAISVYPNPTNGPATIHFDLASSPKAYFSVHNLLGQKVLDGGVTSGASGDMKLDLSSLDAGVYLLVTTTDDGERDVERVVVAK